MLCYILNHLLDHQVFVFNCIYKEESEWLLDTLCVSIYWGIFGVCYWKKEINSLKIKKAMICNGFIQTCRMPPCFKVEVGFWKMFPSIVIIKKIFLQSLFWACWFMSSEWQWLNHYSYSRNALIACQILRGFDLIITHLSGTLHHALMGKRHDYPKLPFDLTSIGICVFGILSLFQLLCVLTDLHQFQG